MASPYSAARSAAATRVSRSVAAAGYCSARPARPLSPPRAVTASGPGTWSGVRRTGALLRRNENRLAPLWQVGRPLL